MIDRVIVSTVAGDHYDALQPATFRSYQRWSPETAFMFSSAPLGQWEYSWKVAAIERARRYGYRYVLWSDVSFKAIRPIDPLWRRIQGHGFFVQKQGDSWLWNWVSDDALGRYGIDRATARNIPLCFSGLVGFDFSNMVAVEMFERWKALADSFAGPHYNIPGQTPVRRGNKYDGHVSFDEGVQGHRHDESALSFVLWKMGLTPDISTLLEVDGVTGFVIGRNFQNPDGTFNAD